MRDQFGRAPVVEATRIQDAKSILDRAGGRGPFAATKSTVYDPRVECIRRPAIESICSVSRVKESQLQTNSDREYDKPNAQRRNRPTDVR